jgi:dihydropyrimidinase
MASALLVRGGTVVGPSGARRGDVLVRDGRIAAVQADLEAAREPEVDVVDAGGAYVVPGGVDVHTHFALPVGAVTSADDFASGTLAAACGGTTCVVDFAGAGREPWQEALATWHERAREAVVDYGFHLTVTDLPEQPEAAVRRFHDFVEHGVTSVKLYLAYPDRLMVDDETLARALAASRRTGVRVCVHAEDGATIEKLAAEAIRAGRTGPEALPSVRPPSVEAEAIGRAAALAGRAGAELYVVHLSSGAGLRAVRAARAAGIDVHAETCPHYLDLDQSHLEAGEPDFVCAPPLRGPADRAALWTAVGHGDVEVVSTDHCPFTTVDRRRGTGGSGWTDFTGIPGGLSGVETRLSLLYQGVLSGRLSLERWVDATAGAPARLFGLDHVKGSLRPGLDADLVVFDPGSRRTLDASTLHSRCDHSPYEGRVVTGWPRLTISRGEVVARDGEPVSPRPGRGRFVRRAPSCGPCA